MIELLTEEQVQKVYSELLHNNPILRNAMMLVPANGLSERYAMMIAIISLAERASQYETLYADKIKMCTCNTHLTTKDEPK